MMGMNGMLPPQQMPTMGFNNSLMGMGMSGFMMPSMYGAFGTGGMPMGGMPGMQGWGEGPLQSPATEVVPLPHRGCLSSGFLSTHTYIYAPEATTRTSPRPCS